MSQHTNEDHSGPQSRANLIRVMRNPLVLDRIAAHLNPKPLRALKKIWEYSHWADHRKTEIDHLLPLRLTCKEWNRVFTPHIKQKHKPITLGSPSCYGASQKITSPLEGLINFKLEAASAGREVPFTRFQIPLAGGPEQPDLDRFLQEFGATVTRLELAWSRFSKIPIAKLGSIIFEKAPLLEELVLYPNNHAAPGDEDEGPLLPNSQGASFVTIPRLKKLIVSSHWLPSRLSLINLLVSVVQSAPNLESLKIDGGAMHLAQPVLQGISRDFPAGSTKLNNLRALKFGDIELPVLKILAQLPWHLESFSVKFSGYGSAEELPETESVFQKFLTSQAPTLKKLKLGFGNFYGKMLEGTLCQLPRMDKLKVFKLERSESSPKAVRIEAEDMCVVYADGLPNLRRFVYHYDGPKEEDENAKDVPSPVNILLDVCLGVTHLEVSGITREQLRQFPAQFPSVEQLVIRLDDGTTELEEGWTLWPNLTKIGGARRDETHH